VVTDPLGFMWMFYGEKGIGKSTLASMMADPYFLCAESAHRHLSIYKTDIGSWTEAQEIVLEVCASDSFKTIVFDPVSVFHQLLCTHLIEKAGAEGINDGVLGYGKGYREAKLTMRKMLNFIGSKGKGIVLCEHEMLKDSTFEGEGELSRYQPALTNSERESIMPPVDIVGRMFPGKYQDGAEMKTGRFISFMNTTAWVGTDKTGRLTKEESIRLTSAEGCWKDIEKAFKEGGKRGHGRVSSG